MFTVSIRTINYHNGEEQTTERNFATIGNALYVFKQAVECEDTQIVDMIDGDTGEVLYQYQNGKFTVLNGYVLD